MTDQTMCRIPWHDGSTRLVPEGTVVEIDRGSDRVLRHVVQGGAS